MTDPIWLSATEAAGLIRQKKLSPVEYLDAVLKRIERLQPTLNCFATVAADSARAAARAAEQAVMRGDALGPLHGVPVNIKDLIDTAGIVTAHGSAVYQTHVPARDNVVVTRLKDAGAIVIGKSTTPEFGHKGLTDSPVFGVTRNPWDRTRTAGGSSGGAAAAVASGQGPLGLGTDGAGSIRIPAAACGTVGHKPTLGLVPYEQAGELFANIAYAGPLSRTVADSAVMTEVIAGPADTDPWTLRAESLTTSPALVGGRLDGVRIGYVAKMANPAVELDVAAATEKMLRLLEQQGAIIEPCATRIDWAEPQGRALYMGNMFTNFARHEVAWAAKMDPVMRDYIAEGRTVTLEMYRQSLFARTRLFHAVQGLFTRYDFLVSPTLPRGALSADFYPGRDEVVIGNQPVGTTRLGWAPYTYPFNLTGHPALTVPSGFTTDGLPTGVQLIGRWWSDLDLFRIGAMLEALAPWRDKRPPEA